jgi:hypothetical protein
MLLPTNTDASSSNSTADRSNEEAFGIVIYNELAASLILPGIGFMSSLDGLVALDFEP